MCANISHRAQAYWSCRHRRYELSVCTWADPVASQRIFQSGLVAAAHTGARVSQAERFPARMCSPFRACLGPRKPIGGPKLPPSDRGYRTVYGPVEFAW